MILFYAISNNNKKERKTHSIFIENEVGIRKMDFINFDCACASHFKKSNIYYDRSMNESFANKYWAV